MTVVQGKGLMQPRAGLVPASGARTIAVWGQRLFSWRGRLATMAILLLAAWLALRVVWGANGWIAYRDKKAQNRQLQLEVEQLQKEAEKVGGKQLE